MYGSQRPQRGDAFQHLSRQLDDAVAPAISQNFDPETGKLIKIKCGSMGPATVACDDALDWDSEKTSDLEAGRAAGVLGVLPDKSYLVWGRIVSGTTGNIHSHVLSTSTDLPTSTTATDTITSTELHYDSALIAISPTNDHILVFANGNAQVIGISNGNLTMKGAVTATEAPGAGGKAIWLSDNRVVIAHGTNTYILSVYNISDPDNPTEEHLVAAAGSSLALASAIAINEAETVIYVAGSTGVESWNWATHSSAPTVGTYISTGSHAFVAMAYNEEEALLYTGIVTSTSNLGLRTFNIQTTDASVFTLNTNNAVAGTYVSGSTIREMSLTDSQADEIGLACYWATNTDGGCYILDVTNPAAVTLAEQVDATATTDTNRKQYSLKPVGSTVGARIWTASALGVPIELYKPKNQNWIIPCQLEVGRVKFTLTDPPCADTRVITGIPTSHGVITNLDADLLDGKQGAYYLDHGNGTGLADDDHPQYLLRDFVNGSFKESFNALVTSDGATITLAYESAAGGDLTAQLSTGISTISSGTIALTAGSDASPQANYIYVLGSTGAVTKSTSDWPATEHIKIGYFLVPSAGFVQTNGVYINQNWNDHLKSTDNMGHMLHMAERSRRLGAIYFSGIAGNGTDGYLTPGVGTTDLKSTAGVVYQMHKHTVPAFDTSAGDVVHVVNWNGDAYHDITDLFDITADSTGAAIGVNKYFNIVVWAVANKSGEYAPMMVNLPSGSYNNQAAAENDTSGYDNFSIPDAFNKQSSTGFLIARITVRMGTTWTVVSTVDLRGLSPSTASGGTPAGTTEFADNAFAIFDETDVTKILNIQCSGITTGNTRTLTIPDAQSPTRTVRSPL
jgi:hypothetical protein